nr:ATPase subunit 8 [Ptenopus garrulus]
MPQLNPTPWFTTMLYAWTLLLLLTKTLTTLQPTPLTPNIHTTLHINPWTWTWH